MEINVHLFDSAVGTNVDVKVKPLQVGELLRVNIGTAPLLGKINKIKSEKANIELRRPACVFEGQNIALSRRIDERWRLIGAGVIG